MNKHTPGPWAIGKSNGNLNTVICLDSRNPIGTALAFTVSRNGRGVDQCEVDARLIAATPELLEFAEKFLSNFEDCTVCDNQLGLDAAGQECYRCKGTGKQIDSVGVLYVDLPNLAQEIIAKATGK